MSKSHSERRASSGALVNLYAADGRIIGHVTKERAAVKCALGKWRAANYEDSSFAGYQVLAPVKITPRLEGSPPTITLTEVLMNAGVFGRSRTRGMPEWKRLARHAKYDDKQILPPEDAIERAQEKVKLWPYPASRVDDGAGEPVYGDKAIRCYPHAR